MTIIQKDGSELEISDTSTLAQVYNALQTAAQRIARNNAPTYLRSAEMNRLPGIRRTNQNAGRGAYTITPEHEKIVKAMPALLAGEITPEEAMAMLHEYDTFKQRIA